MAKKTTTKKIPAKKIAAAKLRGRKKTARSLSKTRATKKTPAGKTAAAKQEAPSLGRPLVTAEEKLYLLFKDDYHARQIFEFLRVDTVRDLEQFSPQEIVSRLSQPIKQTVQRIRVKLAERNRALKDDLEFAVKYGQSNSE